MPADVRVGVTADVRGEDGAPVYDLALLDEAGVAWEWIRGDGELAPADVASYEAIVLYHPYVTRRTLNAAGRLRLIARLGVGVDNIDVDACTSAGVLVTVTPDSVRRPMASGAMAFILALAHRLPEMDRCVRSGRWQRFSNVGLGLVGRTLGIVGLGNVGRELASLAAPFGLRVVAADPFLTTPPKAIEMMVLDELLTQSDIVVLTCPLTAETHHLIDARRIALMKPSGYLVNIARGSIVDGAALADALRRRAIAGAAVDVFEQEPVAPDDPLLALDNVILAPHAVGLTDELLSLGGRSVSRAALDVLGGRMPEHPLNPEAAPSLSRRSQ
ncbi:MAG: dehydrogenase [Actinobacteria bacterium]|nr:dehydrogenase [Actinomycetota bacterium]